MHARTGFIKPCGMTLHVYIHTHIHTHTYIYTNRLQGTVQDDNSILIDFTPKGGPKDLLGKWDKDGIVFPVSLCMCLCLRLCAYKCAYMHM